MNCEDETILLCLTWNFWLSCTLTPFLNHEIAGFGSATIEQWKMSVVPSVSCRIVGLVENVGAIPSTCLLQRAKKRKKRKIRHEKKYVDLFIQHSLCGFTIRQKKPSWYRKIHLCSIGLGNFFC